MGRRILWSGGWLLRRELKGVKGGVALEGCEGRDVEEDASEWKNNLACCVARCGV